MKLCRHCGKYIEPKMPMADHYIHSNTRKRECELVAEPKPEGQGTLIP